MDEQVHVIDYTSQATAIYLGRILFNFAFAVLSFFFCACLALAFAFLRYPLFFELLPVSPLRRLPNPHRLLVADVNLFD
jgi:hypothetical protein